jgi:hypothetical protein
VLEKENFRLEASWKAKLDQHEQEHHDVASHKDQSSSQVKKIDLVLKSPVLRAAVLVLPIC